MGTTFEEYIKKLDQFEFNKLDKKEQEDKTCWYKVKSKDFEYKAHLVQEPEYDHYYIYFTYEQGNE